MRENKSVRYSENKERSAELLRLVLSTMSLHDAAYNPTTFTVCYEHVSGMNHRLSVAFNQATQAKSRLDNDDMRQLHELFVADVDTQVMQRISGELQRMMSGIQESASRTGSQADSYGTELKGLSTALVSADAENLSGVVQHVVVSTAQMIESTSELEKEVKVSQQEISRLKNELLRTRDDSMKDSLTGVLNRKGFDHKLSEMLAEPVTADRAHGLVLLDIDHFKAVNDTHGHVMGDRVLQALGEVLRMLLSNHEGCSVARYGGEEFAVLMPNTDLTQALSLAEKLRAQTQAMKIRDRRTKAVVLTVTISAGVTLMQQDDDPQTLVARADGALYQSKQNGRNRITAA
jgi:diguanylate cyclase